MKPWGDVVIGVTLGLVSLAALLGSLLWFTQGMQTPACPDAMPVGVPPNCQRVP